MADIPTAAEAAAATEAIAEAASNSADKVTKESQKLTNAFELLSRSNIDVVKALSALGKETTGTLETFGKFAKEITNVQGAFKALKAGMDSTVDLIIGSSQQLANIYDKMSADYIKKTGDISGAMGNMGEVMREASQRIAAFGADTTNAAIAVRTLIPRMGEEYANASLGAIKYNKEQEISTVALIASYEKLGVSAQTTAKNINMFQMGMGLSNTSIADAEVKMANTTKSLTVFTKSLSESAEIIQKNSDIVTVFGGEALVDLQAQATATTLSLDTLVEVSKKFDTFESAAEQVGKLNALLGGDMLSVTEMMFAEPAEQVEMLVDAFNRAGVSAENMDPYQKKYMLMTIQNTLGLKSQAEALKFLNASEFQRANMMAEQAKQEESRARIQEQLNQALIQSLPALEGIAELAKLLASLLTPLFEIINTLARATTAFFTPLIMYLNEGNALFEAFRVVLGLAVVAGLAFVSFLISFIVAAPAAGAAAAGLAAVAPALAGALGLTGAVAIETSLAIAALALALFGAGLAIGLIFAGAAALVYTIGELIVKLNETKFSAGDFAIIILSTAGSLVLLAGGIIALTGSLTIFLALLPIVGPAMIALALTLLPLSFSLSTVAESFTTMAESFDSMLSKVSAVKDLTSALKELNTAITELPQASIKFEVKTTSGAGTSEMVGTASSPFTPTEKMIAIEKVVIQFDEAGKTAFSAVVKDIVSEWADSTDFKQKTLRAQGFNIAGGQ